MNTRDEFERRNDTETTQNILVGNLDEIVSCPNCDKAVYQARTRRGVRWIVEIEFDDNCDAIFVIDRETKRPTAVHTMTRCFEYQRELDCADVANADYQPALRDLRSDYK
jgi:hypothetical protein